MAQKAFRLPIAGQSTARDTARPPKSEDQARTDADVPLGAGQEARLVGDADSYPGFGGRFHAEGVAIGPDVHPAIVLVPESAESPAHCRAGQTEWWRSSTLSSRIQVVRRLLKAIIGSRSPRLQAEADETEGNLAFSGGSGMQHGVQTAWERPQQGANELPNGASGITELPSKLAAFIEEEDRACIRGGCRPDRNKIFL